MMILVVNDIINKYKPGIRKLEMVGSDFKHFPREGPGASMKLRENRRLWKVRLCLAALRVKRVVADLLKSA